MALKKSMEFVLNAHGMTLDEAHKKAVASEIPLTTTWWGKVDSNHRRHCQQIYSLSPLATREFPHIDLTLWMELVDGLEPPTC